MCTNEKVALWCKFFNLLLAWSNRDIMPANMHLMVYEQYTFHLSIVCDMLWLMKCSQEVLQDQWWLGMAHTVRSQILQVKKHWYGLVLGWVTACACWRIDLRRWITSVLPGWAELFSHATLCCQWYEQVGDISISADWHQYIHLRIIIGNILATQRSMGENAFLMVFQERWSFLPRAHSILPRAA